MQTAEDAFVITAAPPSRAQRLVALAVVPATVAVLFLLVRPVSSLLPGRLDAFVPFYIGVLFVTDVITAAILFSQFSIVRTSALLFIANAYLFLALMLIPYTLAFPGLFAPGRVMAGGLQTTAWIYILRHCGFAAGMSCYALSMRAIERGGRSVNTHWTVPQSIAATAAVVSVLGAFCVFAQDLLPLAADDLERFSTGWLSLAGLPMASLYVLAMVLLWPQRRTILGLWLFIVAFVHVVAVPLNFFPSPSRFSVGWYAVVVMNLFANSLVLISLLREISNLNRRLMLAVREQRRERDARLVTGDAVAAMVAHEVKQPLAAMITRAETGVRRLDRPMLELDKIKADMRQIAADGHRAAEIIDGIRANFQKGNRTHANVDVHRLISEATASVANELQKRRIAVSIELDAAAPQIFGDWIQLQQVLLNLITNAADAMVATPGYRLIRVRSETHGRGELVISVADAGTGVPPEDAERVFGPLFTTKRSGMGMGLSICRSIIEAHGGRIWVAPNHPAGAIFSFALPLLPEGASILEPARPIKVHPGRT